MELMTWCSVVAALRVSPNKSQFFQYERLSLSCDRWGNVSGWRVMKNTSLHTNEPCLNNKAGSEASYFLYLYPSDSGVYWCQSAAGGCSHAVHISVTGPVILESPALPVAEGDEVVLRCRSNSRSASGSSSSFFRDGVLVGKSAAGNLTIHSISRADGGVYKCQTGAGESPESQLTVMARGSAPSPEPSCCKPERPPEPGLFRLLLPVGAVVVLLLVALLLVCIWRKRKGVGVSLLGQSGVSPQQADADVSYTVVTISQNLRPPRVKDAEIIYSGIRPGGTRQEVTSSPFTSS